MERSRNDLVAQGLGLCSISYDSVDILRAFAERRAITFPLLADPESSVIRQFGLFNEAPSPESREYGMAHPGIFLVHASGIVRDRFFEERYYHRMTMPTVLWRLGAAMRGEGPSVAREHLDIRTGATQRAVHPGNRITLFVDVIPRQGAHVYGPSVAGGYQGLDVQIEPQPFLTIYPPRYPRAASLDLPWADEVLAGYAEPVRIEVDVALGTRQEIASLLEVNQGVTITGTVRAQACDDRVCWAPEIIRVEWRLDLIAPDLARSPEHTQHRPKPPDRAHS